MLPRDSDSDMRRDGSNTTQVQSQNAVDEPGRVHGVPDLLYGRDLRKLASKIVVFTAMEGEWRWRRLAEKLTQIREQDKSSASPYGVSHCLHIVF
jgi:hypothetical protein